MIEDYGLLEGYRMAKSYLNTPCSFSFEDDLEEKKFREQMIVELHKADQI